MGVLIKPLLLALVCIALVACAAGSDGSRLLEGKLERKTSSSGSKLARLEQFVANADRDQPAGILKYGTDRATGPGIDDGFGDAGQDGDIQLNLVDVPVAVAAKSVLGDILELNYSVDPRVQGTITVQTSKPVSAVGMLRIFEGALRGVGGAVVGDGASYRIVPLEEAPRSGGPVQTGKGARELIGQNPYVVTLRYVSADNIREVIEPLVPPGMVVKVDASRNVIILSGTASEISAIRETISIFDVDWMRGMSFGLVAVKSSDPAAIVSDLEQIYDTKRGPLRNVVRFVPNRRLKSVLVITSRSKYLREATNWIRKLDALAATNEQTLHVYRVQNRTAAELAKVLQSILKSEGTGQAVTVAGGSGEVAPKLDEQRMALNAPTGEPAVGPETPPTGPGSPAEIAQQAVEPETASEPVDAGAPAGGIRVVADDANNSLLIFATDAEYQRIRSVLEEVDSQPNQVLLEAVIAEVTLDDELKFGVRWLFGESNNKGTFSDLASGAVASSFPGFSYFLKANDVSFTLNALATVTDVRVLSSPSLVVLDNKTATLQVGDQVPITTQQVQQTTSGDTPIINNIELKDTGVILSVTPRVNDSGRVILDIQQEVSTVVETSTSDIDSPTIRQRKIKTSVVVSDGEALALGGLIQERETTGKTKVPVLGDIPLLGNAFRQKNNIIGRTELIIFIRPRVIRDMEEARRITREFREELSVKAPRVRRGEPTPGEELVRIVE